MTAEDERKITDTVEQAVRGLQSQVDDLKEQIKGFVVTISELKKSVPTGPIKQMVTKTNKTEEPQV
jgi:hypothetical protein